MRMKWILISLIATVPLNVFGQVVTLPCPDGVVDSTSEIQAGLWATRDGGMLQLGACTYYVSQALEARWNHLGSLRGEGMDLTSIEILPGSKIEGVPITSAGGTKLATIFLFENSDHGDISVSDLSIAVSDPEPAGYQDDPWFAGALWNLVAITGQNVEARFERVGFYGASGNLYGFNAAHALQMFDYPMINAKLTVEECLFTGSFVGINPTFFEEGVITISNNFISDAIIGMVLDNCVECMVKIQRNILEHIYGIGVLLPQFGPPGASEYLVDKNDIRINGDGAVGIVLDGGPMHAFISQNRILAQTLDGNGIEIWGRLAEAVVTQNRITVDSSSTGTGIFGLDTENVLLSNNRIDGLGLAAVLTFWSENWTLLGNNVQNFELLPSWNPAPIGIYNSFGFRVVGGENKTNVTWFNEPPLPDGGHIITGVNIMTYTGLGQDISEAMKFKRDIRKYVH